MQVLLVQQRLLGSIQSWLGTNFVTMTDGVAPVGSNGTAARTEGATASAFTEAKLKELLNHVLKMVVTQLY